MPDALPLYGSIRPTWSLTTSQPSSMTRWLTKSFRNLATSGGVTMIGVTYGMHFAWEVADRVVFMDDSVVVEEGLAADLLVNPRTDRLQAFLSRFTASGLGPTV